MKKTILIFIGHYLPSQKAGGALRTIANMVEYLGDDFNFKIITRDRDFGDAKPFENIKVNEWNNEHKCEVFYLTKNQALRTVLNNTEFDTYYLNSFFDLIFSIKIILLRFFDLIKKKKIILAPRGDFMCGALKTRTLKKRIFIVFSKFFKLHKNIIWHASTEREAAEIKREMGHELEYRSAIDVPDFSLLEIKKNKIEKKTGFLKILFLSVIVPKKNLKFAIEVLNKVEGDFIFDIYGPIRDEKYWQECLKAIDPKITDRINYKGEINNSEMHHNLTSEGVLWTNYDLFFFPTLGENFGHVVWESLAFSCPVLTTKTTPWNNLKEYNAGWNFNLDEFDKFKDKIEEIIDFDEFSYNKFINGSFEYVNIFNKQETLKNNLELFR